MPGTFCVIVNNSGLQPSPVDTLKTKCIPAIRQTLLKYFLSVIAGSILIIYRSI
ncbi:MAG: hypothetical protein H7122_03065 [Chitinophagaceae bacterium]|nr:hypothetical protein [Chitinophagaceae bacterium]